ncbi:MAG: hypothetical protein HC836_38505, partial [Richelia sp. RM2_1_2]|nr:hypothetical protein [Richelia sp. RM2_1_2]
MALESAPLISSLQWQKQRFTGDDFTDSTSLAEAILLEPAISQTIAYSFGEKFLMSYLTEGAGKVSENYNIIGSDEYRWALM